jgi:anti-sigma factor RsiW
MEDMTLKPNAQGEPTPEIADDFTWLMSLALDEMLDGPERTRFNAYVADYPALASEWADWQLVDGALDAMPHMLPAPGFVARFETRLAHAEAQQQQRVMTFAFVVVGLALACFVAGALGTGAFVVSTQGPWLGEQIRNLVYAANIVDNWFGAFADTLSSLVSSPQARALGFVYLAMVALVVGGWMQLLQRSTHLAEAAVVIGTE